MAKEKASESVAVAEVKPPEMTVGKVHGGIVPRNFDELWRMSVALFKSGMTPKGFNRAEMVFAALQLGMEVGLGPMQSMQNICVINGRPSIWGDAALALVRSSGLLEDFSEIPELDKAGNVTAYLCTAKRKGQSTIIQHQFSMADARRARLADKDGPWKTYPGRMLQMRARSWVLRDGFPDVLKGCRLTEEERDIPVKPKVASRPELEEWAKSQIGANGNPMLEAKDKATKAAVRAYTRGEDDNPAPSPTEPETTPMPDGLDGLGISKDQTKRIQDKRKVLKLSAAKWQSMLVCAQVTSGKDLSMQQAEWVEAELDRLIAEASTPVPPAEPAMPPKASTAEEPSTDFDRDGAVNEIEHTVRSWKTYGKAVALAQFETACANIGQTPANWQKAGAKIEELLSAVRDIEASG